MRFTTEIAPLDLDQTLGCGQTFRWRQQPDGSWLGPLEDCLIGLRQNGARLLIEARPSGSERSAKRLVRTHLRAEDDVVKVQRVLARDPVLAAGIPRVTGLRIVKIDSWECLCSFTLATYANIPRISKMIETLAQRFGHNIVEGVSAFPSLSELSRATVNELSDCGLGYRARYIHDLCRSVDSRKLRRMESLEYDDLRSELMDLPGVGDKVADCVALFGFGKLESFPIDVWIERALARLFRQRGSYRKLRKFATDRWGPYAGYAQEYLYYNERARASTGACLFTE